MATQVEVEDVRRLIQISIALLTPLAHLGYFERVDAAPYDPIIAQQGVREIVASMPQPGMLHALERRVAAMVEMSTDEPLLSARERDVLAELAAGASRREAAEQMYLSLNTVKTHVQQAYRALGVGTLHDAVERCRELGIPLAARKPVER